MKLDEMEKFRAEEEQLLTAELGPEEARKAAQTAYEARLANIDEEIREQMRLDILKAREKRSAMGRRNRGLSGADEDGLPTVRSSNLSLFTRIERLF